MSSIGVVLDACVLFPGSLRDTLLRTADVGLFRLHLTSQILEEMRSNLVEKGYITEEKSQYIVRQIKEYFAEAFVTKHMSLIPSMPVNKKDRHVLAAALASDAQIIVTQNLKDFPPKYLKPFGIEALSADEFLVRQFFQEREIMVNIVKEQANDLKKPSQTPHQVLRRLENFAPKFVKLVLTQLE